MRERTIGQAMAILLVLACGPPPRKPTSDVEGQIVERAIAAADAPRIADAGAEAPPPELRLVAQSRNGRIKLHPLEGGALVVQSGASFAVATNGALGKLESLGARGDRVEAIFGRWPDDLLFTSLADSGKRSSQHWKHGARAPLGGGDAFLADVAPWSSGKHLALVATPAGARFATLGKKGDGKSSSIAAEAATLVIDAGHCWEHMTALATGEVFTLGKKCGQKTPILGRWMPGETRAAVDVLPGVDWADLADVVTAHVRPLSRTDVVVSLTYKPKDQAAKPYVAKFDGEKWLVLPVPQRHSTVSALARGTDGSIWAVMTDRGALSGDLEGELWHRTASGGWKLVAMPEGEAMTTRFVYSKAEGRYQSVPASRVWAPVDAWISPTGEVWAAAVIHDGSDETWGLFHAGPRTRGARDGGVDDPIDLPEIPPPPPPSASASCAGTFFLALGSLGRGQSDGDTFPTIRDALADRTDVGGSVILEIFETGKRKVGIFTSSRAVAEKLAQLPALARGRKLVVTCEAPVAIRVVRYDAMGRVLEENRDETPPP